MASWRRNIRMLVVLSLLAGVAMAFSHLALVDIWHGTEPDLRLEWWVVRVSFALQWVLIGSVLLWLRKLTIDENKRYKRH